MKERGRRKEEKGSGEEGKGEEGCKKGVSYLEKNDFHPGNSPARTLLKEGEKGKKGEGGMKKRGKRKEKKGKWGGRKGERGV